MVVFVVCAALLGLLAAALAINVSLMRSRKKILLGDGGDPKLLGAIRALANFAEFVPMCLILVDMLDDYYGFRTIAGLSILLLGGRVLHAAGMLGYLKMGRSVGAGLTLVVLIVASVWLILAKMHLMLY